MPSGAGWRGDAKATYWYLLAGPALRINEFVSFYALAGAGTGKAELKERVRFGDYTFSEKSSQRKTGFAWSTGIQFNPVDDVVIDMGYEGSKIDASKLNGFIVGVGYRF